MKISGGVTLSGGVNLAPGSGGSAGGASYGYSSGGIRTFPQPYIYYNTIDKFPFASNSNASDVGDLTVARQGAAGQQG